MKDYVRDLENKIKLCLLVYGERNHEGWNIDDSRFWVFKQFVYAEIVL